MVYVAIAAFTFGAIRAVLDHSGAIRAVLDHARSTNVVVLLCVGGLPMASFLAIGLLLGSRYRGNRRFFWAFEAFGVTTCVLYITAALLFSRELETISKPHRMP